MKKIAFILFTTFLTTQCVSIRNSNPGEWKGCKKIELLFNADKSIPLFYFDLSFGKDSVNKLVLAKFGQDFVNENPSIEMRIPQTFLQSEFNLRIKLNHGMSGPDSSAVNCFPPQSFHKIMINSNDQFLINGEFSHLDSVCPSVENYFTKITDSDFGLDNFIKHLIIVEISDYTSQNCFDNTLKNICNAYLDFIERQTGNSICRNSLTSIEEFRNKFPLNIVVRTGTNPPFEEIRIIESEPVQPKTD